VVTTIAASLVLGVLLALAMIGQGLPAAGSVALGLEFAAAGSMFAAVGAVAAQLTTGAGAARGIAISAVGAAYMIRIPGDISDATWLSWLSPIGWVQRLQPYHDERWWVLVLPVAFTAALAATAVALSARRDVGAGLFPARLGPASAPAGLRTPLALAWRLHRGLLASWTVGFALVGVVLGGVAESVGDLVGDSQTMRDIIARIGGRAGLIDAYLAADLGLLGMVAAAYAIQATLRLRSEETAQRAEPILATAVGRLRWAASHLAFSVLGPTVALAAGGLAMGLTHGANTGDVGREVGRVLAGAAVQLPAVWVLAALAVALVGLAPKLAPAAWAGFALCLLIGLVGVALQLNQWLLDVSPFTHVPRIPGGTVSATPLVWLVVVALALGAAGLVGLRRRDIPVA
jgi:ABC-2 type transport system permease protein